MVDQRLENEEVLIYDFFIFDIIWKPKSFSIEQVARPLWHYRLWSFKTRDTKLERFLQKTQHTQRKLLNFENWCSGGVSKFDFQSQFSMSTFFLIFFH